MRRVGVLAALCWIGLSSPLRAQQPTTNGGVSVSIVGCAVIHKDAAVNNAVSVTTPTPTVSQAIYVCGWDWTVSEDTTATAQTNVLWTTTNLGGLAVEYSMAATPSAVVSGASYYGFLVPASANGAPVTVTSPAAATHAAYSVNLYYRVGPRLP